MDDIEALEERLIELRTEHQDIDEAIEKMYEVQPVNFMQVTRLKKRKLHLKDAIERIESELLPDIIA